MSVSLRLSSELDLHVILDFVCEYHRLEGLELDPAKLRTAVRPLLGASQAGRIWLICLDELAIGYVALCPGYSIEFGGRDGFIDELFLAEAHRGRGHGKVVMELVRKEAAALDIRMLHLEVERTNSRARSLYESAGFTAREQYMLMSTAVPERRA